MPISLVRTVADLRSRIGAARSGGNRIALVPTMGALHAGHLSLVELARRHADVVAVSVFVNPTQFGPNEDFSRYPRQEAEDADLLASAGADLLFAPDVTEVYRPGSSTTVSVGPLSTVLCGAHRPGHFDGVATIVAKLLLMALPDVAIFGEKDFQQLMVIRRVATDLDIPVTILGAPIVRDPDGLALSSRNRYLSPAQRQAALSLPATLQAVSADLRAGAPVAARLEQARAALLAGGFDAVDYVALCDAGTLAPLAQLSGPARLLAAARIGTTRLIDNIAIP